MSTVFKKNSLFSGKNRSPDEFCKRLFPLVLAIFAVVGNFLGFLLAWKRPQSGPVRLFLSGVTLPALILFLVRFSDLIGIG